MAKPADSNLSLIKIQAALCVTVLLWASSYVFIRIGLQGFRPGSLGFFRYLIASGCMLILYLRLKHKNQLSLLQIIRLLIIGVAGIGAYNVFINYGELTVPVGIIAFIISLVPIFTVVLSIFLLNEKIAHKCWWGVAVSMSGMLLIALGENQGAKFDYGVIFALIAAILGSIYIVGQKPLLKILNPIEVALWTILGGTLSMTIFTPQLIQDLHHASVNAIFAAVYLGIFPAAIGYTTWSYALSHTPAFKASLYLYAIPFLSTILGYIILQEVPLMISFIGGLIALSGAAIANYFYFSSKKKVTPPVIPSPPPACAGREKEG